MSTMPMIAPDGSSWDIPSEKVGDAVRAGGKVASSVLGPDGSKWLIPLDQVHAALAKGGQLIGADPKPPQVDMKQSNAPFTHAETDEEKQVREQQEHVTADRYGRAFGFAAGGGINNVAAPGASALGSRIIQAIKQRFRPAMPPAEPELSAAQAAEGESWREPETTEQPAAQQPQAATPKAKPSPRFTAEDKLAATQLLKAATSHVVDEMVPGSNAATKSRVEFYLQRGDIANAEKSLDAGAKQANPAWQPLDRQPVPSTNDIRARIQAEAKIPPAGGAADNLDTHALQQEMNWNRERHGWSAESEARREFIARNSTGVTKGELAKRYAAGSGKAAPAAAAATPDDLTEVLQKSLEAVQAKKLAK
jgi:hypothetical protein